MSIEIMDFETYMSGLSIWRFDLNIKNRYWIKNVKKLKGIIVYLN
jgi:hypothetical protein